MILNEFFNLPQVFEKDMTENEQTLTIGQQMAQDGIVYDHTKEDQLIGIMGEYMERSGMTPKQIRYYLSYDEDFVPDQLSYLPKNGDDAETFVQSEYVPRGREEDPGDLEHDLEQQDYQRRQQRDSDAEKALNKKDQDVEEGIFGSRPSPVLPIVDKIAKVARGLTPQNVEVGKQIIQANARDITRMLSPQDKAGVDVIEQGVAEATGDEKFDTMMGQIQREPKYPDSQMPPTDVKDLYQWAVKNNKPYHKIFAEWANREGYKSVAPALQRAGNLDTEALDYWTPRVWKIYWGEVRGIDSEMPPEWSKKRVPDELRDYLETVFDAYDRIVFDWPTEYRQIGGQDNYAEAKDDYVPPREANYGKKYQAMVLRVGEKARAQEKAKQQQQPKAPVRESRLALLKQIIQS